MSDEISPDLLELFEYDEFDSYQEHLYQVANNPIVETGVPLSVELSESLSRSSINKCLDDVAKTPSPLQPINNAFVKAPEIFLRIETSHNNSSKNGANVDANASCSSSRKLSLGQKSNSLESTDSNDLLSLINRNDDGCVELQYENEFIDSTEDENDCDLVDTGFSTLPTCVDSDYEQLLFEGILSETLNNLFTFVSIFDFCYIFRIKNI